MACDITLLGLRVLFAGMRRLRSRIVLCDRSMRVNAEHGMVYGSSTFEESKSLESSVDGIGKTLRAIDCSLT